MNSAFDVIIAGLGAFGAATARSLAGRGVRTLGLDRFQPPHDRGSHHGRTRIIREAYFENPLYVPLVRQAYDAWTGLEEESGQELLHLTGGLMVGPPDGELVGGTLASARRHGIAHELLGAGELRDRYPRMRVPDGMVGVLEKRAGVLDARGCLQALLDGARAACTELRFDEPVEDWTADGDGVSVRTPRGEYRGGVLVLAAGPWLGRLLGEAVPIPLRVQRQVVHWVLAARSAEDFRVGHLPVAIWEQVPGRFFYVVPDMGDGVKAALHHGGQVTDPDRVARPATDVDREAIRHVLTRFLPDAAGRIRESSVCLYTNTPDGNFLLGRHPLHPRVVLVGGGSGHGFKFAPVLGRLTAALALDEEISPQITPQGNPLDPGRFDR